ncbi:MAG: hypothetical protein Q8891_16040 [Bacteroidota bacterium]|nr:hypothetical protein [Bacteroidota bacterium]
MKKKSKWILIISILIIIVVVSTKLMATYWFGEMQYRHFHLKPGNIEVPHERTIAWKTESAFADTVYHVWADKPIDDNNLSGKNDIPRILLAKLLLKQDIPKVNETIMKLKAWGVTGSSWALNKKGDYDFPLTILTTILWFNGDKPELLYPETKKYLLNTLLTEDGGKFRYTAPRTLGLVAETENHVLMTEGSRYLKNRWLMLHGDKDAKYDNIKNGMEDKILSFLGTMKTNGLYEFNSLPYTGYTITGLLNLEAFASDKVKTEARDVLDYMNWCYALGSYQFKHYPPMRRRYDKAYITELTTDYHSVFMKSWLSFSPVDNYDRNLGKGSPHALIGCCMPYRPPDRAVEMEFHKGNGYFVQLGHGPESCPEIYTAGKHFLLSAGGVNRGERSLIVARPITLFTDDTLQNLSEIFHLAGPGKDYMKWNNTGVYKNFACAAGPVFIPSSCKPVATKNNWSAFLLNDSVSVIVYSTDNLGIIAVFEGVAPSTLLDEIVKANPGKEILQKQFQFPGGEKISYDVHAPRNRWVILPGNDSLPGRNFDQWPLIEGDIKN